MDRLPPPRWLHEAGLQRLFAAIERAGGEARAVGGCVRDHVLSRSGGDIDLASSLLPEPLMQLADAEGWKAVPTGLSHGTVTLVLPERVVEVTTLRRDVTTDGRHAEVAFTTQFEEDAQRRDFTVNALYMDFRGIISDYVGGAEDIAARRIRFIGDAGTRIREDGLRMLRFFRFLATHGQPPADEAAMHAIAAQMRLLERLSGERIQQEMKKLLAAEDPSYALARMSMLAFGERLCGTPWQIGALPALLALEAQHRLQPDPWVRLLVMVTPAQRVAVAVQACERWRLSRADQHALEFLTAPPPLPDADAVREALRHYKREWLLAALLLQAVDGEQDIAALVPIVRSWDVPQFPVTARDLLALGMGEGPAIGERLRQLEARWVESGYRLRRDELLS